MPCALLRQPSKYCHLVDACNVTAGTSAAAAAAAAVAAAAAAAAAAAQAKVHRWRCTPTEPAIEKDVFDPAIWIIHLAGRGTSDVCAPRVRV